MLKKRLLKNQKGLSTIVATLIIILLVLVAVGIIWVVVRNLIQEGAEGIELGMLTLDLEIKRAQIENGDVTVVVVRRNPGEGNYIGMNFVFSDGTNSEIIRENTTLQELEERSFTFTLTEISTSNLTTISVAPIFELSSGEESFGNIADSFEVTEEMKAGIIDVVSNFEMLGFEGAGRREYSISSQSEDVVKIKKAIVDPLDVLPGDNQTFTVHVYSPYNITGVTTTTELDNSTSNLIFLKISEYEESGEIIEIWSVTWIVNDVHAITYRTTIVATDSEGNSDSVTLTWTDSCQSQIAFSDHGVATKTMSTTCNTGASAIGGVDGSNIIIGAGVNLIIDSNAQFIFNQGKSITITAAGASITSTTTGSFGNGELYYMDSDGDNYISGTSTSLLLGSGSGRVRASSAPLLGTSDCYDGNPDVYPGQTTYYTAHRGDNSWDYNCDSGVETKQWTTTGGSCVQCERSTGPVTKSPGTVFNDDVIGNRPWMFIDNAKTSNNEYARRSGLVNGGMSWILKATNFGFSIPSGATIDGIWVQIERKGLANPGIWDNLVRLVDETGNYVGNNKGKSAAWSKTESYFSYGDPWNSWGETWTRAIINDVDFGVGLSVILDPGDGGDPHTALVDHIRITVYYTGICEESSGSLEWTGSAPACGVSGNYYTNSGTCDPQVCTDEGCVYESRTQACR
jgi:hypothetical protein